MPTPTATRDDLPKMSLGEHLEELRKRLFVSLIAVGIAVVGMLPFKTQITHVYVAPYQWMWKKLFVDHCADLEAKVAATPGGLEKMHSSMQSRVLWIRKFGAEVQADLYPAEALNDVNTQGGFAVPPTLFSMGAMQDIWTFMAASLLFGLILASPIVLYQAWAFVAAGLYAHERKAVMRYVPLATTLLLVGVVFGYVFVVPWSTYFLMKLMDFMAVQPLLSVAQYFSLLLTLTAALGVVFQLPLLMLALQKSGIVTHQSMRKHWRYVVLGIFALSAILTPSPDPFTQMMMAVPMCLLYVFGLFLCARVK